MVSQITTGYPTDENGQPYRRRRHLPAIIAMVVLALVGVVVWSVALSDDTTEAAPTDCNQPTPATASSTTAGPNTPPATPAATQTVAPRAEMLEVIPAALSTFQIRVLNASNERGAARSVSDDLTRQGFTPAADNPYGDDPIYPNHDLNCVAQIRFGAAGKSGAAALWVAFPCAELVTDNRRDTSVDVALGTYYKGPDWSQDSKAALEALKAANPKNPDTGVDPSLLSAVHSSSC
ncbi:envelope integrity protein Cei [Gordonia sp. ABSL1-1]|uniref:envelope integrity protein Cei n=1 Tax=Gordonia sp. ABSL1-1 TaxID=3053923 RepID=UPI00257309DE|nr:envelope integrity protein Cei [Gordonia sp. ABSL1-1]MDL9936389.1 envelope integrity protein Cei [Gordonia sp. ABSL1-1]